MQARCRDLHFCLLMISTFLLCGGLTCDRDLPLDDPGTPGSVAAHGLLYGTYLEPHKGVSNGEPIIYFELKDELKTPKGHSRNSGSAKAITSTSYAAVAGPVVPGGGLGQWSAGVALDDRQALFTGGYEPGKNSASARSYLSVPDQNAVVDVGNMITPRRDHRMIRLTDNSVLITGGYTGENPNAVPLDTAERFDPASRAFKAVGNMSRKRSAHNMTVLSDGRVLVVGGDAYDPNATDLYTAEIFDPASETFSPAAPPTDDWKFAVTLNDGRVLAGGAFDQTKAAIYDPTTNAWSLTGAMNSPHSIRPTATVLPDGRVLVVGGWDLNRTATRNTDLYDPAGGLFAAGPAMNHARHGHVAFFMPDGNVLIAAGQNDEGDNLDSFEVFDPDSNTMTLQDSRMSSPNAFGAGVGMMP